MPPFFTQVSHITARKDSHESAEAHLSSPTFRVKGPRERQLKTHTLSAEVGKTLLAGPGERPGVGPPGRPGPGPAGSWQRMTRVRLLVQEGQMQEGLAAIVAPARQHCPAGLKERTPAWPGRVSVIVHRRPRLSMELAKANHHKLVGEEAVKV